MDFVTTSHTNGMDFVTNISINRMSMILVKIVPLKACIWSQKHSKSMDVDTNSSSKGMDLVTNSPIKRLVINTH